jgi:hypothetical protein
MKTSLADAESAADPVSFSSKPSTSNVEELNLKGDQFFAGASKAEVYADAWASVRHAIAVENHKRGIDEKLVRLETLNKMLALHKKAVASAKETGYLPNEIDGYTPDTTRFGPSYNLIVNPLREPQFNAEVTLRYSELQRQVIQLSDEISTANGPQVALNLDPKIIAEVTGAVPA